MDDVGRSAISKISLRILPLLCIGYLFAYMDRVNIGFAAASMNADLKFSATVYGLGGGFFFLSYALFEVPSNLLLVRFGARRWIARIMITWGLLAAAIMFVRTPLQFYGLRFLLGMAEAGFFPAAVYYLARWFPTAQRGGAISRFYVAGPLTAVVMGAVSGALLGLDGRGSLHGWQWLLLIEGLPAVGMGVLILLFLPEAPQTADWLSPAEKAWLKASLDADAARLGEPVRHDMLATLRHPLVLQLGVIGCLCIGAFYALTLSGPLVLKAHAGLDATLAGYVISLGGCCGAVGMLITGPLSDRRGERFGTLLVSSVLLGAVYLALGLLTAPWAVIVAYVLFAAVWTTVTTSLVLLWTDVLPPAMLAVGTAAINSMNQVGGFLGPWLWGVSKDATGGYRVGLAALAVAMALSVVLTVVLRRQVDPRRTHAPAPA